MGDSIQTVAEMPQIAATIPRIESDFSAPFLRQRALVDREHHSDVLGVGVIGYGYWGPNVVRNFQAQEHSRVEMVCDQRPEALAKVARAYPGVETLSDVDALIRSPRIDVVAVVTPVWTHFELAMAALQ